MNPRSPASLSSCAICFYFFSRFGFEGHVLEERCDEVMMVEERCDEVMMIQSNEYVIGMMIVYCWFLQALPQYV